MDAREHVRLGLDRLVGAGGLPASIDARWVNLLLDEVGSDHRALVNLLVTLARTGVVDDLVQRRGTGEPWERLRDRAVQRLAAERFLQAETVRWAVEAWGTALQLAPPPAPPTPARPEPASAVPLRAAARATPVRPTPPPLAPAGTRPGPPNPPAWYNPRPVGTPSPLAPIPPGKFTYFSRSELLMLLGVGALYFGFQLYIVIDARRMDAERARVAAAAAATPRRDTLVSATRPVAPPPPAPTAGALPAPAEDTVVLQSGLRLVGRISLVTESRVRIADRTSGLDVEQPIENIREVASRTGARIPAALLRVAPNRVVPQAAPSNVEVRAPLALVSTPLAAPSPLATGAYRVSVRPLLVTGDPSCRAVWDALPRATNEVRRIAVLPDRGYEMEGQPPVRWRVGTDGQFTSELARGSHLGAAFAFQLRGRVDAGGFNARAITTTESVLKWGRSQVCRIHADVDARPID